MMASIWPASMARAAGAVTWASTLPTATAIPAGSPVHAAASRGEAAGAVAEPPDRVVELELREAGEVGVQGALEVGRRVGAVLPDALVPGGAGVADVLAAELPDDPVGRLDPVVHALVDLRVLFEQLQRLGVLPLARDRPSVPGEPRLAALGGDGVDPVGLRLGGVVLPQLDVGVPAVAELGQLAQRRTVGQHRQRRRRREVRGDADHVARVDARFGDGRRYRGAQHVAIVVGVLQRPLRRQRGSRRRQLAVHHGVAVLVDGRPEHRAVADARRRSPSPTGCRSRRR